jgi:hypothetical protein
LTDIGKYCLRCCRHAGVEIGVCRKCQDPGPVEEVCLECEEARYEPLIGPKLEIKEPELDPQGDRGIFLEAEDVPWPDGRCWSCNQRGKRGNSCSTCSQRIDMEMGTCLVCEDEGPLGEWCQDCKEAPYDEDDHMVDQMGNCPRCDEEGIRGCLCTECEDMGMCYE